MQIFYYLDLWISFSGVIIGWRGWQNAKGPEPAGAPSLQIKK